MQEMIFIADFIACSTCFGQYYAHHQELESIMQMVAACGIWCFGFQVVGMMWSWRLCVRFAGCCSSLQTGHNKICNKYHLLHLVGILFPHINDDARSKSLQITKSFLPLVCLCERSSTYDGQIISIERFLLPTRPLNLMHVKHIT